MSVTGSATCVSPRSMPIRSQRRGARALHRKSTEPAKGGCTLALPMSPVTTSVEELPENKVKLHVSIPASEFERAIDAAFRKLAAEVKIPGFRPGKAPRRLLETHLGTEVAREQAIRDSVPEYYLKAVEVEELDAIAPPEFEITAGQE